MLTILFPSLVINLREAGERIAMGSTGGSSTLGNESSVHWLPAARSGHKFGSEASEVQNSTGILSTMKSRRHGKLANRFGIGTTTFHDTMGLGDFNVPLGEEFFHENEHSEYDVNVIELESRSGAGQSSV